jgi:hypothetical protein
MRLYFYSPIYLEGVERDKPPLVLPAGKVTSGQISNDTQLLEQDLQSTDESQIILRYWHITCKG